MHSYVDSNVLMVVWLCMYMCVYIHIYIDMLVHSVCLVAAVYVFYLTDRKAHAARQINCRNYTFTEFNMVACRITDARNIAANNHHLHNRSTGSISSGQVPLKK